MVTNFPLVGGAPLWMWLVPAVAAATAAGTWMAKVEARARAPQPAAELPKPSSTKAADRAA